MGFQKLGLGDWNDGMSEVGNKGIGESVWLGFFLYDILNKFAQISEKYVNNINESEIIREIGSEGGAQNDSEVMKLGEKRESLQTKESERLEKNNSEMMKSKSEFNNRIKRYKETAETLRKALNTNGWDGRWFKRAFTDNGDVLGTMENEECKIDGISQSWAVISNAGDNDKQFICMEALENHLVDKENGIIKLLDPPFEKSSLQPGYIKAYLPGIRENGGQYTHGAIWSIMALTSLGFGDKARRIF